jgi:EmrB/QacA subfamily drug resistance transporter
MSSPASGQPQPIWLIPLVVASALFMEQMDASVIGTSLPAIALDLGEDPVILKLALTSYLLSLAVFIPISGWCADRYGARPIFQAAIVVFVAASIGCAMANTLVELILARAAQGMGGAMMVPVGRLILLRSVPKSQMISALAYLTIPALVAPVVGPPLGGYITTYFDWRWIFWINVPFGILGVILARLYMPNVRADAVAPLDWPGFALSGLGLAALIFGFTVAGRDILPVWFAPALMAAGTGLLIAYVIHSRRAANPILDLDLMRLPTFRTSIAGGGLFRVGIGAIPFLLPLMLQIGFGLDPFQSGIITFSGAFGALLMKFTATTILRRLGFRRVLTVNALICAVFLGVYGLFSPATSHMLIVAVLLVGGYFRSLQFTALNAIAYADIDELAMSRATALIAVAQQLFLSAGVALAAFVLEISRTLRGDEALEVADFSVAFLVIALLSAASAILHMRLEPGAGADISGHRTITARAQSS